MSGRAHRLITAVAVHETTSGTVREAIDIHTLHMRRLDRPTIEAYVRHDMPLNCAGSYMLEKRGLALFEAIEADPVTADDTAVIGLPMTKTIALLRSFGFEPLKA
jgi:septum formation protein